MGTQSDLGNRRMSAPSALPHPESDALLQGAFTQGSVTPTYSRRVERPQPLITKHGPLNFPEDERSRLEDAARSLLQVLTR